MKLIANRPLHGDYGSVIPGQEFECSDDVAQQLLKMEVAHRADPPTVQYEIAAASHRETKVIVPETSEVGPRLPFRDMPLPDTEPESVASGGDPALPEADVSKQGAAHRFRRRGR